jgi:hypothetical protein
MNYSIQTLALQALHQHATPKSFSFALLFDPAFSVFLFEFSFVFVRFAIPYP